MSAALVLPDEAWISDVSLQLPEDLGEDRLLRLAESLSRIENASPWWIADFIEHLQSRIAKGERRQICKATYTSACKFWPEYSLGRLQNIASISRRIPRRLRRAGLSFAHHEHVAALADEDNAEVLQAHYLKIAVKTECTADELRLMIADTRKGRRHERNGKGVTPSESIAPAEEPELLTGTHAQLASESARSLTRLRDWYKAEQRRQNPAEWSEERKAALMHDLEPLMSLMHELASLCEHLSGVA